LATTKCAVEKSELIGAMRRIIGLLLHRLTPFFSSFLKLQSHLQKLR